MNQSLAVFLHTYDRALSGPRAPVAPAGEAFVGTVNPQDLAYGYNHPYTEALRQQEPRTMSAGSVLLGAMGLVSVGLSAYHGARRNHGSVLWGAAWGASGAVFPIITPAVAFAQGFGEPARK